MDEAGQVARELVEVLVFRVVVRAALGALSLDRAVGTSVVVGGLARKASMPGDRALEEVARVTERWMPGGGILGAKCLERSAVRLAMLRRRGVAAHIRIGVTIVEGRVSAHAWNTLDGVVLFGDTEHERVRPIWDSTGALQGGCGAREGPDPGWLRGANAPVFGRDEGGANG